MKTTKELLLTPSHEEEAEGWAWIYALLRRLGFHGFYEDRLVPYEAAHSFRRRIGYLHVFFERHPHYEMDEMIHADNFVSMNYQGYTNLANPFRQVTDDEIQKALETAIQAAQETPVPDTLRDWPRRPDTSPEYEPLLEALDARWAELFR